MPLDIKTLCQYRLDRAKEDLLTAVNNHQAGFYKAAINRSYYAIFVSIVETYLDNKLNGLTYHNFLRQRGCREIDGPLSKLSKKQFSK